MSNIKMELFCDNFQNYKRYNIPKAQLVIADIPYNIGVDAYASNPMWYNGGDNKNGESKLAKKSFFNTDGYFKIAEYMHFCSKLLIKEPKEKGKAPAMIVFCAFEQMQMVIEYGKKYGFEKSYPLFFVKNYSGQVLKANMKIVGATEFAVVLYRDKLPKFNNGGKMVFNWFEWRRDSSKEYPKIHPTQKPVSVIKRLIEIFTDPGDVVIDPCAGSGSTLRAAYEMGRHSYGFEVDKRIYRDAQEKMLKPARDLSLQTKLEVYPMIIKIKNHTDNPLPKAMPGNDWIDLYCAEEVEMDRGCYKHLSLGISVELPEGYEAIVTARSCTPHRFGIICANGFGAIDNSYCGDGDVWELPVLAIRHTIINKGDRIAQFRIQRNQPTVELVEVESLGNPDRGGWGSTGTR